MVPCGVDKLLEFFPGEKAILAGEEFGVSGLFVVLRNWNLIEN